MKNVYFALLISCAISCNAQTHQLITTGMYGGSAGIGAIYMADSVGSNFHQVYSFTQSLGQWPLGNLAIDTNGLVFGVTELGGPSDSCVIYSFDPATDTYNMLHDFGATENLGWWDQTGPILLPDGNLYGLGQDGGLYGGGVIYRLNPTTLLYQDIFDFDTASTSGTTPEGGLLYANGKLYGMNIEGGTYGKGAIFCFDPVTDSFTALHQFIDSSGSNPATGALIMGADGKELYGVTKSGGPYQAGVIFSYTFNTGVYTCLHKFNPIYDGADPNNALLQATDGNLYGLANDGGAPYSAGTLFRYNLHTDSFNVLYTFDITHGSKPLSSLTQAWNGLIYGTASDGGTNGAGVIFSYNIDSSAYTVIYNFDSTGGYPGGIVLDYYKPIPTGIAPVTSAAAFQVMPNPAGNYVCVQTTAAADYRFDLLNNLGQVVATGAAQLTYTFNTRSLGSGLYTLRVINRQNNTITGVQKVVIEH